MEAGRTEIQGHHSECEESLGCETKKPNPIVARHKELTGKAGSPVPQGLPCKYLMMPISLLSPNRAKSVTLCPPHGPSGHPVGSNFSTLAKGQSWTVQCASCHILMGQHYLKGGDASGSPDPAPTPEGAVLSSAATAMLEWLCSELSTVDRPKAGAHH